MQLVKVWLNKDQDMGIAGSRENCLNFLGGKGSNL